MSRGLATDGVPAASGRIAYVLTAGGWSVAFADGALMAIENPADTFACIGQGTR